MNQETFNKLFVPEPKNPEITEELKEAIADYWISSPFYSIYVRRTEKIGCDFYMNDTKSLLYYIKNCINLNDYINEEGKKEQIELTYTDNGTRGLVSLVGGNSYRTGKTALTGKIVIYVIQEEEK